MLGGYGEHVTVVIRGRIGGVLELRGGDWPAPHHLSSPRLTAFLHLHHHTLVVQLHYGTCRGANTYTGGQERESVQVSLHKGAYMGAND
jgi:hypothetical protein